MSAAVPKARTGDILAQLISFPTVSADSNLALIDYVEDLLKTAGFETCRLADPNLPKAGLMARIGPKGPGGVMLSAHSDVVPVEGQDWTRPPFDMTRADGRIYGRGSTDMKGFLASALSLAERAGEAPLAQPLMLAISYDEEVGCQGIRKMIPGIEALGWRP
ncbi:M20/M25/M40 family metallo-hydrolase, partial [Pseudophaeobacter sp.]